MALRKVFIVGGIEYRAQSGSGFVVQSGGYITVQAGGNLYVAGDATIQSGGRLYVASGGQQVVQSGGLLSVASGSNMNVAGATIFTGTVALRGTTTVEANSVTTVQGTSGNVATWTFGDYSTLTINAGSTYSVAADCARSGADIPSGNNAYRALRVQSGATSSTSYSPERFDILKLPVGGVAGAVNYTLNDPPHPIAFMVSKQGDPGGGTINLLNSGAVGIGASFSGATVEAAMIVWDGSAWSVLRS